MSQLPTPAANWLAEGRPDPHAGQYDGDRHTLALGQLTDDELANALFLGGNEPLDIKRVMANDPNYFPAIGLLTAGKERIRWLSRKLTAAEAERAELLAALEFMVANIGQPACLETKAGFAAARAAIAAAKGGAQ